MEQVTQSNIAIYKSSLPDKALRQGEFLAGLTQLKLDLSTFDTNDKKFDPLVHPLAIVISQDCDLDQDFTVRTQTNNSENVDKLIPSVLFCEITTAGLLRGRADINSGMWSRIKINKDERYHFFQRIKKEEDYLQDGIDELGADFKRYFTIPTTEVYLRIKRGEVKRRCFLNSPYLEHFTSRFHYYHSRVALPEDHFSEPSA